MSALQKSHQHLSAFMDCFILLLLSGLLSFLCLLVLFMEV